MNAIETPESFEHSETTSDGYSETSPEAMIAETRLMLRLRVNLVVNEEVSPYQWCLDREHHDRVDRYAAARFLKEEMGIDAGI